MWYSHLFSQGLINKFYHGARETGKKETFLLKGTFLGNFISAILWLRNLFNTENFLGSLWKMCPSDPGATLNEWEFPPAGLEPLCLSKVPHVVSALAPTEPRTRFVRWLLPLCLGLGRCWAPRRGQGQYSATRSCLRYTPRAHLRFDSLFNTWPPPVGSPSLCSQGRLHLTVGGRTSNVCALAHGLFHWLLGAWTTLDYILGEFIQIALFIFSIFQIICKSGLHFFL